MADVVVVGAGVAGLTAARELQRRGYATVVLERDSQPGGRIVTEGWQDARIELGVHFLTPGYHRTLKLMDELRLARDLVPVENGTRIAFRHDARWHYLDAGRPLELLTSPLIGWRHRMALARAALPILMPPAALDVGDITSAADLDRGSISEVCTPAVANRLFGPVLELLLGYPPHEQAFGLLSTFLLPRGQLRTLAGGMGDLITALTAQSDVRCGVEAERVEPTGRGVRVHARARDGTEETYHARTALLAIPGNRVLGIWPWAPLSTRRFLRAIRYSQVNLLYLRTRARFEHRSPRGLPVYAGLRTRADRRAESLVGVGFLNSWADAGGLLLAGAAPASPAAQRSDDGFTETLQTEVELLYPQLRGQLAAARPLRGSTYVPIFGPGTVKRLRHFRSILEPGPVALAGDYLAGPCMEGAVASAHAAADKIDAFLQCDQRVEVQLAA